MWPAVAVPLIRVRIHSGILGVRQKQSCQPTSMSHVKAYQSCVTQFNPFILTQINLYLLSRVILGLLRLMMKQKILPEIADPKLSVFPWFSAFMFGIMPWLHEYHIKTLQPSLQQSMTYLYHDCEKWTNLDDFLLYNKAGEI